MIYALPAVLFFSYYPLIHFGSSESMNFEISLPMIWLVVFDVLALVIMIKKKMWPKNFGKKWLWLMLPIYLALSLCWSQNLVRGILTVGILWLIYFAVYAFYTMRNLLKSEGVREVFWKVFFGSAVVICVWCFVQCVLDIVGVGREQTLMCAGCTYSMFGFPHPNGFAIEPQFMGNLLLAPAIMAAWLLVDKQTNKILEWECSRDSNFNNGSGGAAPRTFRCSLRDRCENYNGSRSLYPKILFSCFFIVSTTLFLTFSRGAIYAFIIAMVFMSGFVIMRAKKWKVAVKRVGVVWGVIALSFLFTLNLQGIMAALGPTNDTYNDGVAKVLNHLSLGTVDLRNSESGIEDSQVVEGEVEKNEPVENSVENFEENSGEEAVFDGYVAESTDTRLRLNNAAIQVWQKDFATVMFGVGLGGAGQALYRNGLSPAPKEIVQNQYASLLMESGLVGILLLILTLVLIGRAIMRQCGKKAVMIWALILSYGVSLCFFAGLPNALHIYLLPAILIYLV